MTNDEYYYEILKQIRLYTDYKLLRFVNPKNFFSTLNFFG